VPFSASTFIAPIFCSVGQDLQEITNYGTAPSKGVILDEFSEHKSPISTSLVQI
jgi:hypothetical protein